MTGGDCGSSSANSQRLPCGSSVTWWRSAGPRGRDGGGRRSAGGAGGMLLPVAAVVIVQHHAAPVQFRLGRRRVEEADAEGDVAGERQLRDIPWRHGVGQAAAAGLGIARHAPQRPLDAREQEEHHQRQRRGQGDDFQAQLQALRAAAAPRRCTGTKAARSAARPWPAPPAAPRPCLANGKIPPESGSSRGTAPRRDRAWRAFRAA